MSRIAIIGGHGKVALLLARHLAERGDDVSSIIRNPDHSADVAAAGAIPVVADVEALTTAELTALLAGHDAVVWSAGAGGGSPARTYAVDRDAAIRSMDAASAAGAKRYVMVSYFGAGPEHGVDEGNSFFAYAEAKTAADEYLRASALDWTILAPSTLTLESGTGAIDSSAEQATTVSRDNVARVADAVLADAGTIGRTIRFNDGPTPIADALHG